MSPHVIWMVPPSRLADNVAQRRQRLRSSLNARMGQFAAELQAWAKANHPWQNQTGMAEATFTVTVTHGGLRIVASHGVYYGIYLEFKHGGRWGVIRPLIDHARGPGKRMLDEVVREVLS